MSNIFNGSMNANMTNGYIEQIPYVMDFPKRQKPNTRDNNMSKFDLEAAKRGEAVQIKSSTGWKDLHFVGVSATGKHVCIETLDAGDTAWLSIDSEFLRMKPKQREMFVFPYNSDGVVFTSTPCETREEAEIVKRNFPKPAGEVQIILVEE